MFGKFKKFLISDVNDHLVHKCRSNVKSIHHVVKVESGKEFHNIPLLKSKSNQTHLSNDLKYHLSTS
jgi:hypothetical protein